MKSLPIALLILLSIAGCKKKDLVEEKKYEVSFHRDGIKEEFSPFFCTIQPHTTMPGKTEFMLAAQSISQTDHLGITIVVTGDLQVGRYESTTSNHTVTADYFKNVGLANERDYTIDHAPTTVNSAFTVDITGLDSKEVRGTFTGNYLYDRPNNESTIITEGNFVVKRSN